ncbi:MAG: hypothetical protein WBG02_04375 [Candidatus Acidiferrum sp.]
MFSRQIVLTLSFLLLLSSQSATNTLPSENTFAVRVDPSVNPAELQVRYFITGEFGGFSGYQVDQDGERAILIHTELEGKPAKGLKAVLYAPGCQIQTISMVELSTSSREGEFHCTPLGETLLQGRFPQGPSNPAQRMEVQVRYLGFWGHNFFGITDGFVLSFDITKSSVGPDGSFQAYLPNFAESGAQSPQVEDAAFQLILRDPDSGNFLAELKPPASLSRAGNLKIIPSYPQTIEFDTDWRQVGPAVKF